jgi:hypothetical protein
MLVSPKRGLLKLEIWEIWELWEETENQNASERIVATLTNTLYAPQLSAIMVHQTNLVVVREVDKNKATGGQG